MKKMLSSLLFVSSCLILPSVQAAIVYDNGVTDSSARLSDADDTIGSNYVSDNFSLTAGSTTFDEVSWTGVYSASNTAQATDSFTIELYADNAGLPALTSFASFNVGNAVNRTDTGTDLFGFDLYSYSASISSQTLSAGTTYWISIFNDTSVDADDDWFWGTQSSGSSADRLTTGSAWTSRAFEMNFVLSNNAVVTPIPAAVWLFGTGIVGLIGASKRKKAHPINTTVA